jgi:predicted MFS family arabinose efflux permease
MPTLPPSNRGVTPASKSSVPSTTSAVAERPRARTATLAVFFVHGFLFASWTAHIPAVKAHLGLTDATLGIVLLCTPIGSVIAMTLTGRLLAKRGSRRMVQLCLVGYCAAGPFVGLAASPVELGGALLVWGAFQGALDVSMNTQGIAVQLAQDRELMPTFHGGWSLGALGGAGIGVAAVAAHVALDTQMLILAVPVIVAGALLTPSMIADRGPAHDQPHQRGLWRNRTVIWLGLIALATMLCEGATADWSAVYLRGPAHAGPAVAGLGYTLFALSMAAVRLLGTRLLERYRSERLIPALVLVAAAGMAAALLSGNAIIGLIGFASVGAGTSLVVPIVFSAAGHLRDAPSGASIAAVSTWGWAGFVCGPPLIGQLAGAGGLRGALVVLPVLSLLVALAMSRPLTAER